MPRLTLLSRFPLNGMGLSPCATRRCRPCGFPGDESGVAHARERLAASLWPDSHEEAARQSLRQCISTLRHDCADLPLSADHDLLGFDTGPSRTTSTNSRMQYPIRPSPI